MEGEFDLINKISPKLVVNIALVFLLYFTIFSIAYIGDF